MMYVFQLNVSACLLFYLHESPIFHLLLSCIAFAEYIYSCSICLTKLPLLFFISVLKLIYIVFDFLHHLLRMI